MSKSYEPPEFMKMIELLIPIKLEWEGKFYTVDEWREKAVRECSENRKQDKAAIYNKFTSALLEGFRTKGKNFGPRIELMNKYIQNLTDVTPGIIQTILRKNNYPLKKRGADVISGAKKIVEPRAFQWEKYFLKAETEYESGYPHDKFLKIKGVGPKVRDLALSEFSNRFCAIDVHVADVIRRTGLLLYGYGQRDFGTSPTQNYDFLRRLIIQFAKESGWSPDSSDGYSPKEIDRIFWFFGNERGICKGNPECYRCPITEICLTFQNWKSAPIKPRSELKKERQEQKRRTNELIRIYIKEHPEIIEELKKKGALGE